MADLAERMKKRAQTKEAADKTPEQPFRKPERAQPKRLAVDLTVDDHRWLMQHRANTGVAASELIRGLISLAREDDQLARTAAERGLPDPGPGRPRTR